MGTGWEYKLAHLGNPMGEDVEARANAFGRLGWELVAIDVGTWVFKRPTPLVEEGTAEAVMEQTVPLAETSSGIASVAIPSITS
jgi:hypothetical protein